MITRAFTALVGTALLATPAYAQAVESVSVVVRIADLDLSSVEGRDRLDRSVRQAARQICGAEPRDLQMRIPNQLCREDVLEDAAVTIAALKDRSAPVQVARRAQ